MRFPHHARMSVTRREEKELRLGAFIVRGLEVMAALAQGAAPQPARRALLAIARSAQSPVVKSIVAHARAIAGRGGAARLLLARPDAGLSESLVALHAAGLDCGVRLARNPRLIEAHEQLVIGACVCWTGDTMRRDPAISDAYESFVEDCPEIAAAAAATFERLWSDGEPLTGHRAQAAGGMPKETPASLLARQA
jgi:hypothetical protein